MRWGLIFLNEDDIHKGSCLFQGVYTQDTAQVSSVPPFQIIKGPIDPGPSMYGMDSPDVVLIGYLKDLIGSNNEEKMASNWTWCTKATNSIN